MTNGKTILVQGSTKYLKVLEDHKYGFVQQFASRLQNVISVSDFCVFGEDHKPVFDLAWNNIVANGLKAIDRKLVFEYVEDLKLEYLKTVEDEDGMIDLSNEIVETLASMTQVANSNEDQEIQNEK